MLKFLPFTTAFCGYLALALLAMGFHGVGTSADPQIAADYTRTQVFWSGFFCAVVGVLALAVLAWSMRLFGKALLTPRRANNDNRRIFNG